MYILEFSFNTECWRNHRLVIDKPMGNYQYWAFLWCSCSISFSSSPINNPISNLIVSLCLLYTSISGLSTIHTLYICIIYTYISCPICEQRSKYSANKREPMTCPFLHCLYNSLCTYTYPYSRRLFCSISCITFNSPYFMSGNCPDSLYTYRLGK